MKNRYDFSDGKRVAVIPYPGNADRHVSRPRHSSRLEEPAVENPPGLSKPNQRTHQGRIIGLAGKPITAEQVRKLVREEFAAIE